MKIAGRKNDGAWFRTNRAIQSLTGTEPANLAGSIANSDYIEDAWQALEDMRAEAGVTITGLPADAQAWATRMVAEGIPRQIWNGRLSFTTYSRSGAGNLLSPYKYTANYQSPIHHFAKDLRKICKRYFMVRRQLRDTMDTGFSQEGNPGGNPDATQE